MTLQDCRNAPKLCIILQYYHLVQYTCLKYYILSALFTVLRRGGTTHVSHQVVE